MKFFVFTNTSGEVFKASFSTKKQKLKAYKRMWKYYNSDYRLHPIWEFLNLDEDKNDIYLYNKACQGNIWAIQRCLKLMWNRTDLKNSFYGKIVYKS